MFQVVRKAFCGEQGKLTLLGQSYGGFVMLTYLSLFPTSLDRCLFTFGLAPVLRSADQVYAATFSRMHERNRRFYDRYPGDQAKVLAIAHHLAAREAKGEPVLLPSGGHLTVRRFQMSGLALGSADGMERLHFLLEDAWCEPGEDLSTAFLHGVDTLHAFETNPIYWLLHESIYADGAGGATQWAAGRAQDAWRTPADPLAAFRSAESQDTTDAQTPSLFDPAFVLSQPDTPLYLTGEMVFDWMGEDFAGLRPLQRAAQLLAGKDDWTNLYDHRALADTQVPCAALVSYEDIYVERVFSEETARLLGPNCKVWVTNEFQHSGLRDCPARVFDTLMDMVKGNLAIPS